MRLVNLIQEMVVDAVQFQQHCPTAAGGCIPWVDIAVALDAGTTEAGFGCRAEGERWRGHIEVFVTGRVVLYDQRTGLNPGSWPYQAHDLRVQSTCTARDHEYGYHIEQSLEPVLLELHGFVSSEYPDANDCERHFLRAQRQAKKTFHKALEQTRTREAELHKVGWYPKRSRLGLGWKSCP